MKRAAIAYGLILIAAIALAQPVSGESVVSTPAPGSAATPAPASSSGMTPTPGPGSLATPAPGSSARVTSSPSPTPPPNSSLVRYSGRLLDIQHGFVFFTTGDGFRLAPSASIIDSATGKILTLATLPPMTGKYASAAFDPATGRISVLSISLRPLKTEAGYEQIKAFAVASSTPAANPDLAQSASGNNGKPVAVTFTVQVPPTTPLTDTVYIATDLSGWSAVAIKMDRIDALHYRVTRNLSSGSIVNYRYTRGSWTSSERGQDGLEVAPHHYKVGNLDVARRDDVVYHWGDENPSAPNVGPCSLPTPFAQSPFVLPTGVATVPPHVSVPTPAAPVKH